MDGGGLAPNSIGLNVIESTYIQIALIRNWRHPYSENTEGDSMTAKC